MTAERIHTNFALASNALEFAIELIGDAIQLLQAYVT
jgi:hypothetical protein